MIKNFLKLFMAFLLTLLVAFLCVEVLVRIFAPQERGLFIADPYIRTIHKPNVETIRKTVEYESRMKTNSQGFVGEDFSLAKGENTYRIATLGDSFTEAFDVDLDKSYSSLLEKTLDSASGELDYQVYNFGVSGSASTHELLTYKHYASVYQPDIVIWQIYLGNDLADDLLLRSNIESAGAPTIEEARTGTLRAFLSNNFHSPRFFLRQLEKISAIRDVLAKYNIISRQLDTYDAKRSYPFIYDVFNVGEDTIFTENFPLTCEFVEQFKDETTKNNSNLIVLLIPSKEEVIDEEWDKLLAQFPEMKGKTWNRLQPLERLRPCLEEKEVAYVDMYPIFKEIIDTGGERMYYSTDVHLNSYGHQLVAEALFKRIQEFLIK